eukprot:scaffold1839_cov382-Prasinococcus_capsulatus_cf.AAC.21
MNAVSSGLPPSPSAREEAGGRQGLTTREPATRPTSGAGAAVGGWVILCLASPGAAQRGEERAAPRLAALRPFPVPSLGLACLPFPSLSLACGPSPARGG